jgi:uncharacterized membrane protein (UPF0127 family)
MPGRATALNVTRQVTLGTHVRVADTSLERGVGLLKDTELAEGHGLWIIPCNSIHSFWMKFVFDAVFLDRHLKVVHLVREMKPWRISKIKFEAHSVLELPPGAIAGSGTEFGDQFEMRRESPGT